MNIKILDSWLKEYLKTKATTAKIAEMLSLTSVSVERLEEVTPRGGTANTDFVYDIEVTTNRPDLMSVIGIAREAAAILPEFGVQAEFVPPKISQIFSPIGGRLQRSRSHDSFEVKRKTSNLSIEIKNDSSLVDRICAVIMEVNLKESPNYIKQRLEASGIRSLNNVIDVTNYVMREIGHPTHVFDYDRLTTKKLIIRASKKGENVITLDGKTHILQGGDIVADNGTGEIVDLLGVMGTQNSVVTNNTKRILFFLDNNKPNVIRKTSMSLAIRTEAAVLNEKGVDPELAIDALFRGIELFRQTADGKILSKVIDIYPNKPQIKHIKISEEKINTVIGIKIPVKKSAEILDRLGFKTKLENEAPPSKLRGIGAEFLRSRQPPFAKATEGFPFTPSFSKQALRYSAKRNKNISVIVPSWRNNDIGIQEDIVEEIARVYGYYKLPSILPPLTYVEPLNLFNNSFYLEERVKQALKYWGFTETYTYSFVSEEMLEGPIEKALTIANQLSEDMVYLKKTLVPSLLRVVKENESKETIKIFELANIYIPRENNLPNEILTLAGVIHLEGGRLKRSGSHDSFEVNGEKLFYETKGIVEQLLNDLGIKNLSFKPGENGGAQADIYIGKDILGKIELIDPDISNFELNFEEVTKHVNLSKVYNPTPKFPPVIEDINITADNEITYEEIVSLIKKQSDLITKVTLIDVYENKKTFRINYQDSKKTLTNEEVSKIREKIYSALEKELNIKVI